MLDQHSMSLDIKLWGEKLTQDFYEQWKAKYQQWRSGFKVFYSPVYLKPPIIILGYNPGGGEEEFITDMEKFEKGDFSLPLQHEYTSMNYPIAKKMRSFFEKHMKLLETSVKLNLFFFRSKNIDELNKLSPTLRHEMEQLCYNKFLEIIDFLKPQLLFVEGLKTYDLIKYILPNFFVESNLILRNRRLSSVGKWNDIPVYGIIHPTGSRLSQDD